MIRFGLCCIFYKEPIRFRTTTAKVLQRFSRPEQLEKLSDLCLHNVQSLLTALQTVKSMGIGAFRILSPLFPRFTHPDVGYELDELPQESMIRKTLADIRDFRRQHDIRLSFHPDQFIVLSSPHAHVIENSIKEIEYQGMLAEIIGAEVINIHAGGAYGDKRSALKRLAETFSHLSQRVQTRLTLENDDATYTVRDLLPICEKLNIPLVYDVHHHRCNQDGMGIEEATLLVVALWDSLEKEPYFHLSSPKYGWQSGNIKPHADYIDPADFPESWKNCTATVDIEAKFKELAVLRLMADLGYPSQ